MFIKKSRRVILILIIALEVIGCLFSISTHEYLGALLIPFIALSVLSKSVLFFITTLSYSIVIIALVDHIYTLVISILIVILSTANAIIGSHEVKNVKFIYTVLLLYTPVYIIIPRAFTLAAASFSTYLALVAYEYIRLSKSRVNIVLTNPTTYLNESVGLVFEITCKGLFKYTIQVDENTVKTGTGGDRVIDVVKLKATRLGLIKNTVKIALSDLRSIAVVKHGPFEIDYTVLPKFSDFIRRAQRILQYYAKHVSAPSISKIVLELGAVEETGPEEIASITSSSINIKIPVFTQRGKELYEQVGLVSSTLEPTEKSPKAFSKVGKIHKYHEGKPFFKIHISWKTPKWLLEKVIMATKTQVGEYLGAREYQPGDNPRMIHWKKSFRRDDVEDLAVKVYSASNIDEYSGRGRYIVIADLIATSLNELDMLLQALYSYILSRISEKSESAFSEFLLYIITPRGEMYSMKGKAIDVLLGLNTIIQEEEIVPQYDYESWIRSNSPIKETPLDPIKTLVNYYTAYSYALLIDLLNRGVKKGGVLLIYSRALSFKYYVVSSVLKDHGFTIISFNALS